MSHLKQRKEKSCLNCNAAINGRFCSVCGQENLETKESISHLILHFFKDITHFDGKFFSSLKYIITKPSFLSSEYISGRRQSYLNPVRFYVFTAFVFFLILFPYINNNRSSKDKDKNSSDFIVLKPTPTNKSTENDTANYTQKNEVEDKRKLDSFYFSEYKNVEEYDSLLKKGKIKDNYFEQIWAHKQLDWNKKFDRKEEKLKESLYENMLHNTPTMLLISLPFFAFFLKLIYWRSKQYFYVSHVIFVIHLYIFNYISILILLAVSYFKKAYHLNFLKFVALFILAYMVFYWYKAMRNFYMQSRIKTIFKYFLIFLWLLFLFLLLMTATFFFSLIKT